MRHWLQVVGWLACVAYSTIPRVLADDSSLCRQVACAAAVSISLTVTRVDDNVGRGGAGYRALAERLALSNGLGLGSRGSVVYLRALPLFAIRKEFQREATGRRAGNSRQKSRAAAGDGWNPFPGVQHPVYLAHLCEMLAWSVGTGLAVCWGLTAFAVVTGAVMIGMMKESWKSGLAILTATIAGPCRRFYQSVRASPAIIWVT